MHNTDTRTHRHPKILTRDSFPKMIRLFLIVRSKFSKLIIHIHIIIICKMKIIHYFIESISSSLSGSMGSASDSYSVGPWIKALLKKKCTSIWLYRYWINIFRKGIFKNIFFYYNNFMNHKKSVFKVSHEMKKVGNHWYIWPVATNVWANTLLLQKCMCCEVIWLNNQSSIYCWETQMRNILHF